MLEKMLLQKFYDESEFELLSYLDYWERVILYSIASSTHAFKLMNSIMQL